MENMLEEPLVFLIILILVFLLRSVLKEHILGPFYPIILRLFFIGVIVHELSHYIMNLAVGIKPRGINVKWRGGRGERSPRGSVLSKPCSFLQTFLIVFAPLYIGTWLIFLCLEVVFSSLFHPLIRIGFAFFGLSILFTANPSSPDFRNLPWAFKQDILHSLYQILLVALSVLILWGFLAISRFYFTLDFYYYLAIAGNYFVLKYSVVGIQVFYQKIRSHQFKKVGQLPYKRFIRKRYKPRRMVNLQEEYLGE